MKKILTCCLVLQTVYAQRSPIFDSPAFSIYGDKVVQGDNEAKAISSSHMVSNYQSPANKFQSANIIFKFSINGRDNEMFPGKDHHFTVNDVNGQAQTPIIKFGTQLEQPAIENKYLLPNTSLKIRLDMKDVLQQFEDKGYYTTVGGDKIYKEDFKGVFIAGPTAPMTWDFDNLVNFPELSLKDEDKDGIYEAILVLNKQSDEKHTDAEWKLSKDISPYPKYNSPFMISDAIYNLSLEEMLKAIEADSTFRTGKEWSGVWTRDISYSIILSMAHLQPRVAMFSLMRKVNAKKRIIQDTGTGGAWPISTDRMIWAVAAWELYKATGDKDWLQQAYIIIKNSIDDDLYNAHDPGTGLVNGESSFLDWREQTYPKWMQPADIYESQCLGTNAAHYEANNILSQMATEINDRVAATKYKLVADNIKKGINKYLWLEDKGYYAQFRYGRNYKIVSPRSEALGEALCIIFGIADMAKAKRIVASTPVTTYGISCIYPQIPNIPPYHNNAVWPFVQTFWLWAGSKAGNERSVLESISDIYRPAAMFLTNKENFVVDNGDFNGTQINSSVMLWSLSGNISIVHKVLFGIRFNANSLSFEPFVPMSMAGKRTLNNFKYRDAVFNIEMEGYGNQVTSFLLDGILQKPIIAATLKGTHTVRIILGNNHAVGRINKVDNYYSLPAPDAKLDKNIISWQPVTGAKKYRILKNGIRIAETASTSYIASSQSAEYVVIAIDEKNIGSFTSEPLVFGDEKPIVIELENISGKADYPYKGATADGFTEISTTVNKSIKIPVTITYKGWYLVTFRYANGNGPTNTENKCAIRTLRVDNIKKGIIVLPQRGKEEWSNWGNSNRIKILLNEGKHVFRVSLDPPNENMNGSINQAMLDNMSLKRITTVSNQ
ncbi:MAG: hypothetical protein ABIO04_01875 [Ferruginibacter sp.]